LGVVVSEVEGSNRQFIGEAAARGEGGLGEVKI